MAKTYQVVNNTLEVTSTEVSVIALTAAQYHQKLANLANRVQRIDNEIASLTAKRAGFQNMHDELSIYLPDMPPAP